MTSPMRRNGRPCHFNAERARAVPWLIAACLTVAAAAPAHAATATPATVKPAAKARPGSKAGPATRARTGGGKRSARPAGKPAPAETPAPAGPATPPPDSSPMADLKTSHVAVKRLLRKQAPSWSPEHEPRNAELSRLVGGFLDFEELAKRALARHWDGLAPPRRAEFVKTLRDLIERNYVTQIHGQADYDLRFDKERKSDTEASVNAVLTTTVKGKPVTVALEYRILWKGRWLVYDVLTDEQSLLENYRSEFNKIINRDGFDALLGRMKKKLAAKSE